MDYFVLKRGDIVGPFRKEDLVAQLATHALEPGDVAQIEGSQHWVPVRELIDAPDPVEDQPGAVAPDWRTLGVWACRRLRYFVFYEPLRAGFVCLAIGVAIVLLSWWPPLLWLPWFLIAGLAGILLFRAGAAGTATVLLACVLLGIVLGWVIMGRAARHGLRAEPASEIGDRGSTRSAAKTAPLRAAPLPK